MMKFKFKIAEKIIEAEVVYQSTADYCKEYFANNDETTDIDVKITPQMLVDERQIHVNENPEIKDEYLTDPYLEILALYRTIVEKLVEYDIIMFHGSAIAVDGEAYIFTALSGTGKSTHTRLWREHFGKRAVMVNDDKPLIALKDKSAVVYGTPWNGKHRLGSNMSAPIKAICILERDAENHIEKIDARDAYPMFYQQTYRSKNPAKLVKTLSLIDRMTKFTNKYRLGCNMNPEAAIVSYQGMQK